MQIVRISCPRTINALSLVYWPLAEDGQHIHIIRQTMLCRFLYALLSLVFWEGDKGTGILWQTIERNHLAGIAIQPTHCVFRGDAPTRTDLMRPPIERTR